MKIALEKVWKTLEGDLVEDGHELAAALVAVKGEAVSDAILSGLSSVEKFFKAVNTPADEAKPAKAADSKPAAVIVKAPAAVETPKPAEKPVIVAKPVLKKAAKEKSAKPAKK